ARRGAGVACPAGSRTTSARPSARTSSTWVTSVRMPRTTSGTHPACSRNGRSQRRREVRELAQQRPRVTRVDDLLDEERFGRPKRRLPRGQLLLDLRTQGVGVVGGFELG